MRYSDMGDSTSTMQSKYQSNTKCIALHVHIYNCCITFSIFIIKSLLFSQWKILYFSRNLIYIHATATPTIYGNSFIFENAVNWISKPQIFFIFWSPEVKSSRYRGHLYSSNNNNSRIYTLYRIENFYMCVSLHRIELWHFSCCSSVWAALAVGSQVVAHR